MTLNHELTVIDDLNIEKIDNTYFKITIKLTDGRTIVSEKVKLGVTNIEQREENIVYDKNIPYGYKVPLYKYKIFLEGECYLGEDNTFLKIY